MREDLQHTVPGQAYRLSSSAVMLRAPHLAKTPLAFPLYINDKPSSGPANKKNAQKVAALLGPRFYFGVSSSIFKAIPNETSARHVQPILRKTIFPQAAHKKCAPILAITLPTFSDTSTISAPRGVLHGPALQLLLKPLVLVSRSSRPVGKRLYLLRQSSHLLLRHLQFSRLLWWSQRVRGCACVDMPYAICRLVPREQNRGSRQDYGTSSQTTFRQASSQGSR